MKKASTSATFVLVLVSSYLAASLLTDFSFENYPPGTVTSNLGRSFDSWGTGDALLIVEAENSITPLHGTQMVRGGRDLGTISDDIYHPFDLTYCADAVEAGLAVADFSAFFNAAGQGAAWVSVAWALDIQGPAYDRVFSSPYFHPGPSPTPTDTDLETWEQLKVSRYEIDPTAKLLFLGVHFESEGVPTYADYAHLRVCCYVPVALDISPGECPNYIGKGDIKFAIPDVEPTQIDTNTIELAGIQPKRCIVADKSTPWSVPPEDIYDCTTEKDGIRELVCTVDGAELLTLNGLFPDDMERLEFTAQMLDGTLIGGADWVVVEEDKGGAGAAAGAGGEEKEHCRNGIDDDGDGLVDCDDEECANKGFCR